MKVQKGDMKSVSNELLAKLLVSSTPFTENCYRIVPFSNVDEHSYFFFSTAGLFAEFTKRKEVQENG